MKKILIMAILLMSSLCGAFENERLNTLLTKLQMRDVLIQENINRGTSFVLTVGADANCQYSLIKSAINEANLNGTADHYEIRVAHNKVYAENFIMRKQNLTLKGGYANCSDANNDITDGVQTQIDGSTSSVALPVILVRNNNININYHMDIINFDISGGVGSNATTGNGLLGGGISVMDDNIELNIVDSLIHDNTGINGGGLYAVGTSTDVYIKDSLLALNGAIDGGGVYCDGASVTIYGNSGVSFNDATESTLGKGGGIYATNACYINIFSGTSGGIFDFRGIAGNKAGRDGGGIYADDGAQILLMGYLFFGEFGNNDEPVNIVGNTANTNDSSGRGGGIYAKDDSTNISAFATIINSNEVKSWGSFPSSAGAMYLVEAGFSIKKLDSATCWDQLKCNQISDNKVFGENSSEAGITALNGDVNVTIKNTWISGHHASRNAFVFAQFADITMQGNIFTNNGGDSIEGNETLMSFYGGSSNVSVTHNTFVNNEINLGLIEINETPVLLVNANIFKETNAVNILKTGSGSASASTFDCLIVHENQSFTGTSIYVQDPGFVDELNEDFHLGSTSPAIDLCGNSATNNDIDDQNRGWDDLLTDNINGSYDAGADEFIPATTADLQVDNTFLTAGPFYPRAILEYEITVVNNGPDVATNVHVESATTRMSLIDVQSTNCSAFPCVIPALGNGSSEVISVTAKLSSIAGVFDNIVTVYSEDFDPNVSDNTDDNENGGVSIIDHVDLQVTYFNITTKGPYHSGQHISYYASVTNVGPEAARNVVIRESTISPNTQVVNVTSDECTQLPCEIADFPVGETIGLDMEVMIITGGSFGFAIEMLTDSTDDDDSNNTGALTSNLNAQNTGDLSIVSQLITPPDYIQGQTVEIELLLNNSGPNVIGQIEVSAVLANLSISSVSGAGCTNLPCESLVLESGESNAITVMAIINESGNFSLDSTISSSNSFDPDLGNNVSSIQQSTIDTDIIFKDSFE